MTRNEVAAWALGDGWKADAYGHLHKGEYRLKMQPKAVRLERGYHTPDTHYSKGEKRWVRVRSEYYGKLTLGTLANWSKYVDLRCSRQPQLPPNPSSLGSAGVEGGSVLG